MNKTVHDLATVVVDVAEYVGEADEAERFSRAIDGMSAVISYVDFMVNLFDIFKVAFGLDNEIPLNPFHRNCTIHLRSKNYCNRLVHNLGK